VRKGHSYSLPIELIGLIERRAREVGLSASDVATAFLRAGSGVPDDVIQALGLEGKLKPGPEKSAADRNQQLVLDVLLKGPWDAKTDGRMAMSLREIRTVTGMSTAAMKQALFRLTQAGEVSCLGEIQICLENSTNEVSEVCWRARAAKSPLAGS
jgi:hypothetical protein